MERKMVGGSLSLDIGMVIPPMVRRLKIANIRMIIHNEFEDIGKTVGFEAEKVIIHVLEGEYIVRKHKLIITIIAAAKCGLIDELDGRVGEMGELIGQHGRMKESAIEGAGRGGAGGVGSVVARRGGRRCAGGRMHVTGGLIGVRSGREGGFIV